MGQQEWDPEGSAGQQLRILFAASECRPFEQTGALGDLTASLPAALAALGHQVEIVLPLYLRALLLPVDSRIPIRPASQFPRVKIRIGPFLFRSRIYTTSLPGTSVAVHLVDSDTLQYFTARSAMAAPYSFNDNFTRFTFFSKVVATIAARRPLRPAVVHCHDWQTGMVPLYLSTLFHWSKIASVFSIHNIDQTSSILPEPFYRLTRLRDSRHPGLYDWKDRGILHHGRMDMLKAGIVRSDMVSTLSPTYAKELQQPESGGSYAEALRWIADQGRLMGIVHGLEEQWRPSPPAGPSPAPEPRAAAKQRLQQALDLPQDPAALVALMTTRLRRAKGYPLLPETLARLRQVGVPLQLVVCASGEPLVLDELLVHSSPSLPIRYRPYSEELARSLLFPGADVLLMPSLSEPCGTQQLIAQAHGTVPIVRATGGLRDTVHDAQDGFVFEGYHPLDLAEAVQRAYRLFRDDPAGWGALQRRCRAQPRSWEQAALDYLVLYREAISRARRDDRFG